MLLYPQNLHQVPKLEKIPLISKDPLELDIFWLYLRISLYN